MKTRKLWMLAVLVAFGAIMADGQGLEDIRKSSIHGVKLFRKTGQLSYPIIRLNERETLELRFDDLSSGSRSYFYTMVLCNADWSPANLSQMDYIRGFTQNRISQYRFSSGTKTRYVHYQVSLPAANSYPIRSGNYLLKVYENSDTTKLLFCRRMMVVDEKITVATQIQQPFAQETFRTHQKIITRVDMARLDVPNPGRDLNVVVLQNNRWDNARYASTPTFVRGKVLEYSAEDKFVFEAGKEWRWLDLRSFRLQSDRVASVNHRSDGFDVFVRPDTARSPMRYLYYRDMNGWFQFENLEPINPFWQSDYAKVYFTFLPQNPDAFRLQNLYLYGELTNWSLTEANRLTWNENTNAFETSMMLKNGYYSYSYVTRPLNQPTAPASFSITEGNMWEAENNYTVLVYYRAFGSRADELVGYTETNTLANVVR